MTRLFLAFVLPALFDYVLCANIMILKHPGTVICVNNNFAGGVPIFTRGCPYLQLIYAPGCVYSHKCTHPGAYTYVNTVELPLSGRNGTKGWP